RIFLQPVKAQLFRRMLVLLLLNEFRESPNKLDLLRGQIPQSVKRAVVPDAERRKHVAALQIRGVDVSLVLQNEAVQHAGLGRVAHLDRRRSDERHIGLELLETGDRFLAQQVRAVERIERRKQKVEARGASE